MRFNVNLSVCKVLYSMILKNRQKYLTPRFQYRLNNNNAEFAGLTCLDLREPRSPILKARRIFPRRRYYDIGKCSCRGSCCKT